MSESVPLQRCVQDIPVGTISQGMQVMATVLMRHSTCSWYVGSKKSSNTMEQAEEALGPNLPYQCCHQSISWAILNASCGGYPEDTPLGDGLPVSLWRCARK